MLKDTVIYIPAYNAALTLPKVLNRIPSEIRSEVGLILVIDNCSDDDTEKVALKYKEENNLQNLKVIRNSRNLGYGGSQKLAYSLCIESGFRIVAMLHGDAQYAPEYLENLLNPVIEEKYDLIFGSRMKGNPLKGGMPFHRFLGNRFLTLVQNIFLGMWLSEYHSGYRVFSVDALKKTKFERLSSDYHFDTEILILFKQKHLRIGETPIPTYYGEEENYVNIWKYGIDVLVTTLTYFFHAVGIRKSRSWNRILEE